MATLVCKTKIESFTTIKGVGFSYDGKVGDFLFFKIGTPKFQQMLKIHKREWMGISEQIQIVDSRKDNWYENKNNRADNKRIKFSN